MDRLVDASGVRAPKRPGRHLRIDSMTVDALFRVAALHSPVRGGGRCGRCGFTYTNKVTECPALRSTRRELQRRGAFPAISRASGPTEHDTGQEPCRVNSSLWDIDQTNYQGALKAIDGCAGCPMLAMCKAAVARDFEAGSPPSSMIWAGVPYDQFGNAIAVGQLRKFFGNRDGRRARSIGSESAA
jgi:hypothetical protein